MFYKSEIQNQKVKIGLHYRFKIKTFLPDFCLQKNTKLVFHSLFKTFPVVDCVEVVMGKVIAVVAPAVTLSVTMSGQMLYNFNPFHM